MASLPKARFLYVDDVEDWRVQISGLLEEHNFVVVTAATAAQALEHLQGSGSFDLGIFDMRLDEKDEHNTAGADLAFRVRDTVLICQDYRHLPVGVSQDQALLYDTSYTGIKRLEETLAQVVEATLDAPPVPRQLTRPRLIPKTYAAFVPGTDVGSSAISNIISPVVKSLGLDELTVVRPDTGARAMDEDLDRIQQAAVIVAEISEGDAGVYYNIGAGDALRNTGVILLVKQGFEQRFNLRGRASIIEYDTKHRTAIKAQQLLEQRMRACPGIGDSGNAAD